MSTTAPYHHGSLRAALLDAVEQLLLEHGEDGVSLRRAARLAGVSHAAPAHHFGDLHGLLSAVAERGHERFAEALRSARDAAPDADLAARFYATGWAYVQFAADNQGVFSIMFRGSLAGSPTSGALSSESFGVLSDLIREGTGGLPADDPAVLRLALYVWSCVHGVAELWIQQIQLFDEPDRTMGLRELYELVASSLMTGLRADPAWVVHPDG